jgi:phosphate transport system substrate-binding protein
VPIFNIGADWQTLNFSGEVLGAIFSGKITRWDDPALQKLNPNTIMPNGIITVIHRNDSTDTSTLLKDYLSSVSPEWRERSYPTWANGQGGTGNEGVLELVNRLLFSIGYVDVPFAIQHRLVRAAIQNQAGRFVPATKATLAAATSGQRKSSSTTSRSPLLSASGNDAYPIASYLWIIVPKSLHDAGKDSAVESFVKWVQSEGQSDVAQFGYVPLSKPAAGKAR